MPVIPLRQPAAPADPALDVKLAHLAIGIRQHVQTSTTAAREAGLMLIEAKALLPHGAWLPWLSTRFEMKGRTAQAYMQLARDPNPQRVADLPLRVALKQARKPRDAARQTVQTIILHTHTGEQIGYPLPESPVTFNLTNEHTSWAAWSWNPITGCLHGCEFCYAREIAMSPTTKAHFPRRLHPSVPSREAGGAG